MTAQPHIRPFAPADAPAWVAISNAILNRQATAEALRAENEGCGAAQTNCRWVAEAAGRVTGTAHLHFFPFDPPDFLSASVMVSPDHRAQGTGGLLWQTLQSEAGRLGVANLASSVADTDEASLAWAQRRGFAPQSHRFASELALTDFNGAPFQGDLDRVAVQGVTLTDLVGADEATLDRFSCRCRAPCNFSGAAKPAYLQRLKGFQLPLR